MRDFQSVRMFMKVVELKGASAAARALDLPRSTVSRQLSDLETSLGARLVQRSTRSFGLTEAGSLVYREFCRIADARATIADALATDVPTGVLRVTAPFSFALNMLAPVMPAFLAKHPELTVSLDVSIRRVDVIGDNFDIALRAGKVDSSTLVGRKLGVTPFILCAAPDYLAHAPPLAEPADLATHAILAFHHDVETLRSWTLVRGDERVTVAFQPRFAANDHMVLRSAALDGAGITCLPQRLCQAALNTGQLVVCLPDWWHGEAELYALYPHRRALSPKVRAFIDHLAESLDFS